MKLWGKPKRGTRARCFVKWAGIVTTGQKHSSGARTHGCLWTAFNISLMRGSSAAGGLVPAPSALTPMNSDTYFYLSRMRPSPILVQLRSPSHTCHESQWCWKPQNTWVTYILLRDWIQWHIREHTVLGNDPVLVSWNKRPRGRQLLWLVSCVNTTGTLGARCLIKHYSG